MEGGEKDVEAKGGRRKGPDLVARTEKAAAVRRRAARHHVRHLCPEPSAKRSFTQLCRSNYMIVFVSVGQEEF